jgi:hypothetical protein
MDRTVHRRERLRRRLKADGVEGLFVVSESNVRYLTGFTGDSSALVLTADRALVVSDGRYLTQLEQESPGLEVELRAIGQPLVQALAGVITKLSLARLAFESEALPAADFLTLRQTLKAVALRPVTGRVERLRAVKDRGKIAAIRAAVAMAEWDFTMLRAELRPDDSEKDAAGALEGYLRHCGATAASFPLIVAVGARSALPHAGPVPEVRIGAADFVIVDRVRGCAGSGTHLLTIVNSRAQNQNVWEAPPLAHLEMPSAIRKAGNMFEMSEKLARFLRNLSLDLDLRDAFEADRALILADADLPMADREWLLEGDPDRWRSFLSDGEAPVPPTI